MLSPCLFNLYAEYIMQNARLDEAQAEIKIARRSINNLSTQMTPSLWQKAKNSTFEFYILNKVKKESEKVGLKLNIQITKIMAPSPITPWQTDGETWKQ